VETDRRGAFEAADARLPARPQTGDRIAYSFDTAIASRPPSGNTARDYYSTPYHEQVRHAFQPFYEDNVDVALLNLTNSTLQYRLLVVPGLYVMDERSAAAVRRYVREGGTVVMTAFSAKVDEHNQWFGTPLPGRLDDVFGIRTSEFYRPSVLPEIAFEGRSLRASIDFYEVLEPRSARTLATFTNTPRDHPPSRSTTTGRGAQSTWALRHSHPSSGRSCAVSMRAWRREGTGDSRRRLGASGRGGGSCT